MSLAACLFTLARSAVREAGQLHGQAVAMYHASFAGYGDKAAEGFNAFLGKLREVFAPAAAVAKARPPSPKKLAAIFGNLGIPQQPRPTAGA